jgi:hypothetical protein
MRSEVSEEIAHLKKTSSVDEIQRFPTSVNTEGKRAA